MDEETGRDAVAEKRAMVDRWVFGARPQQIGALAEAAVAADDSQFKLGVMFGACDGSVARFAIRHDMHPYAAAKVLAAAGHVDRGHPFLHEGRGEGAIDETPAILGEIGRRGLDVWGGQYENFHDRETHAAHLRKFGADGVMRAARQSKADLASVAHLAEASAIKMGREIRDGDAAGLDGVYRWMRGMAEVSVEIARRETPFAQERETAKGVDRG